MGGKSLYKGPFKYDVSTLCGGGVSHTLAFLNIYDEGGMGQERANKTLFGGTPDKKKMISYSMKSSLHYECRNASTQKCM